MVGLEGSSGWPGKGGGGIMWRRVWNMDSGEYGLELVPQLTTVIDFNTLQVVRPGLLRYPSL